MNYFIIIRGPAGSGKTIVSILLAKALKSKCIHIDKILKEKGLAYIKGEKWVPPGNLIKVNKIIEPYINEELRKGKNIVVEGNFYHKSVIKNLLSKVKYNHFAFNLKAGVVECINRDKKRKPIGPDSIKAVHKLVSRFDYGVLINTENKTINQVVKEIIYYLPKS